jgi:prepilin peptidase CpaA
VHLVWTETQAWFVSHLNLILPFIIALWISWSDLRTRKIPNYLTLGAALAGLAYNLAVYGWGGLGTSMLGLLLGFGLLILPYLLGGIGAGDVKAMAALGAWLGPAWTLSLFCYMAIAGGLLSLAIMIWKGILWQKIRQGWVYLLNLLLCQSRGKTVVSPPMQVIKGIPYGVAIALGMGMLLVTGTGSG